MWKSTLYLPGDYRAADFLSWRDLAPAHKAKTSTDWFSDRDFTVLDRADPEIDSLKAANWATWASVTPEQSVGAVICGKEVQTKYWG